MSTFTEPLTVEEVMNQCRIITVDQSETVYLNSLIASAREWVEGYTGKLYGSRDVVETFTDVKSVYNLANSPATSLESVIVTNSEGSNTDLTSYFKLDVKNNLISGSNLPAVTPSDDFYPVSVTYTAGCAMPSMVKHACKLIIAHWYEHREEVMDGVSLVRIPQGAISILEMIRHGGL